MTRKYKFIYEEHNLCVWTGFDENASARDGPMKTRARHTDGSAAGARPAFMILMTVLLSMSFLLSLSGAARAESVTGTWTSRVPGEGFVQDASPADWHYDVKLTISSGSSGTWWMKVTSVTNVKPGAESARQNVGNTFTYHITYTVSGSRFTMKMEGETMQLTVSGGRMTGSGTTAMFDGTTVRWTVDLKGGSGELAVASIPVAGLAVAAAVIGIGASLLPAPVASPAGFRPMPPGRAPMAPSYQPGTVSQTPDWAAGPPAATTYMGGVGLTTPALVDQNGTPFPPRRYPSQYPPRCPNHPEIPCQALFPFQNQNEPGSWFCPKCRASGIKDGYPWGMNPP